MAPKKSKSSQPQASTSSKQSSSGGTHIYVRHILCEKQSKILEAKAKLDSGISFDTVAREMSEDKARQGGLLGWKTRQDLVGAFVDNVWNLPTNQPSQPFKTGFGYHIAVVENRK
ncbi:hypothetical protein RCL1_004993 [Eukaryota sp. TZLM3-RCL]